MINNFGFDTGPALIYCDNQSALQLAKNPVFHARTKHIEVHFHFVREKVESGAIRIEYCPTGEQVADAMTKALGTEKFVFCREGLGVMEYASHP